MTLSSMFLGPFGFSFTARNMPLTTDKSRTLKASLNFSMTWSSYSRSNWSPCVSARINAAATSMSVVVDVSATL